MTDALQTFESRILLCCPSIGFWRGSYQISDTSVQVGGETVDSTAVTSPRTKLLDGSSYLKEQQKVFSALSSEKTKLVERLSIPASLQGVRITPIAAVPELMTALIGTVDASGNPVFDPTREQQSIAFRLGSAADTFVANYDRVIEELAVNTPAKIWSDVKSRIPHRGVMRGLFYLRCPAVRIASANNEALRIDGVDMSNIDTIFRQAAERQIDEAVTQIVIAPRAELRKAITDLRQLINQDGRVTTKSFAPVRAAQQKFGLFEFGTLADQPELAARLSALTKSMNDIIPTELNERVSRENGFDTLLKDTIDLLSDSPKTQEITASFKRRIRKLG